MALSKANRSALKHSNLENSAPNRHEIPLPSKMGQLVDEWLNSLSKATRLGGFGVLYVGINKAIFFAGHVFNDHKLSLQWFISFHHQGDGLSFVGCSVNCCDMVNLSRVEPLVKAFSLPAHLLGLRSINCVLVSQLATLLGLFVSLHVISFRPLVC